MVIIKLSAVLKLIQMNSVGMSMILEELVTIT